MIRRYFIAISLALGFSTFLASSATGQITYSPKQGPGAGKHVVLLAGDEEYRSEEAMPMLGKILSQRHGFNCTVVFSIDPKTGVINPNESTNLPGMEALKTADACIMLWRFRAPSDEHMAIFEDYIKRGKPLIALRTSTHPFTGLKGAYARYNWNSKAPWDGGFGQQVLGETWFSHHGDHAKESARGIIEASAKTDPILRGVDDIWGPSDVYGTPHVPADAKILVRGQVIKGMKPSDPPVDGAKNNPMQAMIWTRQFKNEAGTTNQILTSTIGAAVDLESEGLRRLVINAVYAHCGLKVPAKADVTPIGEYKPTFFGFDKFIPNVKPEAHALK